MSLASTTPFYSYDSSIEVGAKDQKLMMDFQQAPKKGGLKTMPFIMANNVPANEIFEKVASTGLLANMINYLTKDYHMTAAKGGTVLFLWSALSNFLPIFGASLSDSYLGRFRVITLGSFISLAVKLVQSINSLSITPPA
ncbi:putative peptide transporter [Acorus calamus]|uniref:Peptide transporter n=1 Tax=Acorus calamus TaxID=4465 RepID=A0AAV9CK79_ACOCL|nr:putative peptide transporter [Acorus calamus]